VVEPNGYGINPDGKPVLVAWQVEGSGGFTCRAKKKPRRSSAWPGWILDI
jgi:hypothetical protein